MPKLQQLKQAQHAQHAMQVVRTSEQTMLVGGALQMYGITEPDRQSSQTDSSQHNQHLSVVSAAGWTTHQKHSP